MGKSYNFKKKIKDKGPNSSPEARGVRLKKLRNMANLTRKEISDRYDLNVNTYKGWEIARFGGLPLDGAKKVINRVAEEGIICSLDWLLYGDGIGPITEAVPAHILKNKSELSVLKEIHLYKSLNKNIIFTEIIDDGMAPLYNKGDYVAGEKKCSCDIDTLVNQNCLVQLNSGNVIVRKLKKGTEKVTYNLSCINSNTKEKRPILYNVQLKCAAKIARHYKV
jgi:transcriptional regulator with XRE-family HTH domain